MEFKKVFFLEESGRTPTRASALGLLNRIFSNDTEMTVNIFGGPFLLKPKILAAKINRNTVVAVVTRDYSGYYIIREQKSLKTFKRALLKGEASSYDIAESLFMKDIEKQRRKAS